MIPPYVYGWDFADNDIIANDGIPGKINVKAMSVIGAIINDWAGEGAVFKTDVVGSYAVGIADVEDSFKRTISEQRVVSA